MKKFTRFLLCFCAPLILSLFLVGCGDEGAEKYTVVYTVDGDQYCDMTYDVGTAPTLPEAPKKSGYSFSGWTLNGSLWNEAAHTSEDITVIAEFTPITYTVTYYNNLDDTSNPNPTSYTVISEDFNIEPLSFGGYRFIGWYADAALETPADTLIEKGSYGDLTFYGKWELIEHTATFKADGVTVGEVKFSEFSSSIDMPAIPEKLGYNAEWENFTLGAEDITVNAVYTPITYTITYYKNLDNASNPNPASYTVISEDFNIEPLSFEGYNFLGWYSDSALKTPADTLIEKGSSGNLVFYGKWELEEHSAIFKADGIPVGEVKFNEFTSLIDEPAVPEKNGYTGAWESYSLGAEDITVNAVYTPIIYTITYYERLDGVTNVNKTEYTVESEDFTISPLKHQHYLFDGWFTDEICTALADTNIEKGTTGNVVLYAKWTAKEYTVTFKADGETVANVGFTVETESIQKPEVPKKAGYNAKWEAFMLGTESFTVNAVYTPITYRITYETNLSGVSGGTLATFTVESETFSLPIPEEENCVFIGWYTDKALTVAANEQIEKGSVGDVKLYAKLECTHSYDYTVTKKAAALKDGVGTYSCKTCGRSYTEVIPATKSIKILAIGNSYSVDATRYLYGILEQAGIEEIRIVNMYIAGCPIDTHWENIQGDLSAYTLYESSKTSKTMVSDKTGSKSIRYAMELDDWDIVTLQQRSNYAGLPSTYTNLQNVIDYVKENEPGADIYCHMTWAYSPSRCESYPEFDRTQMGMYNAIIDTVNSVILNNPDIVGIIPTGTAIQNLRTSFLGDDLTRDNTHLSNGTGRYTAAMIWAKALTGCDLTDITGTPSYSSDNESYGDEIRANLVYIKEAVNNAYENPFAVTDSVYTEAPEDVGGGNENEGGEVGGGDTGGDTEGGESDGGETADPPTEVDFDATLSELTEDDIAYLTENGYSPDDYQVLDITFYDNEYYNFNLDLVNKMRSFNIWLSREGGHFPANENLKLSVAPDDWY